MKQFITTVFLCAISVTVSAKCTLRDFNGDWRVMMTIVPLEDPAGEAIAQRGGDLACTVRFDRRGQFVPVADNRCQQSGLNYSFGQIRAGSVQQPVTLPAAKSCQFQITLDFDRDGSEETQTVTLANVYLDKAKIGFAAEVDVAEPEDDVWHAGTAWGFKPAR
jgi:hypothetical protein